LDLAISVDTSVVNLAGALGRPAWVLLPFLCDWRWRVDRYDTPWYPAARLFRQANIGDWTTVLDDVRAALEQRVRARV
jgi:ADP-heptose:LPS heptosyltransferase